MVPIVPAAAFPGSLDDLERDLASFPAEVEGKLRQMMGESTLTDDPAAQARAFILLGGTLFYQGRYAEMLEAVQQGLRLAKELGLTALEAQGLNALGLASREQRRIAEAFGYFRQSLSVCRATGDQLGEARALCNVGFIYRILRMPERALEVLLEAQELILHVRQSPYSLAIACLLAWTFLDLGRPQQGLAVVNLFLPLAEEGQQFKFMVNLMCARAMCFTQLGFLPHALSSAQKAVAWVSQGAPDPDGESYRVLGQVQSQLGQYDEAVSNLHLALEKAEATGQVFERCLAVTALLNVYQRVGASDKAQELEGRNVGFPDAVVLPSLSVGVMN